MKQSFTKEEIREVVLEIIGDHWQDIFKKALHKPWFSGSTERSSHPKTLKKKKKKSVSEIDFVTNVESWIDAFVDEAGRYIGPSIGGFHDGVYVRNPGEDPTTSDLDNVKRWNEGLAEYEGFNQMAAWKANSDAHDHFMHTVMNRQAYFPT
jgi:hypothetical protein